MARRTITVSRAPAWIKRVTNEWVGLAILYRHANNKSEYRKIKKNIDNFIRDQDLDYDSVWFIHGDPDDPSQHRQVIQHAKAAVGVS
jgi:hypothetical protein